MAADRALAEDNHAARENVRAFHGDAHRRALPGATEVIARAENHGLAAMDVHGVVDHDAHALGGVQLHDPRDHRGMMALVERGAGQPASGIKQIGRAGDAGERLLDALELRDRDAELLADAGIGAGGACGIGCAGRRQRRQRYAAAGGERRHQHLPALAQPLLATDDVVQRNEDVVAPVRAVLEHLHRRQMTVADLDARQMRRDQCNGDAEVFLLADELVGIIGLEGETEQRRDRAKRDVALVPVQLEADHLAALEGALADHALVDHRGGIRAGFRAGQPEAGNVAAVGEARQPAVLLLPGAEAHQELAGPQ